MELLLTDEQKLLRESAATLVERAAGPGRVRVLCDTDDALDRTAWKHVAEAGWLAILAPEEAGGLGLGMTEACLVIEQAGRGLLAAPVGAAAVAVQAMAQADGGAIRERILPAVMGGDTVVLPALQEGPLGVDLNIVSASATPDGDGYRINGAKSVVPDAAAADGFLVNAAAPAGQVVCYLPRDAAGLTLQASATVDGAGFGAITFDGAQVPPEHLVAGPNRGPEVAATLHDGMLIGLGAELLGIMEQALDVTIEYLKVRQQFDRPIGSFQALQHRAVNEYVEVEGTRSLVFQVADALDAGRGNTAMASAVKAKASAAGLAVTKAAIQMHGAIGFTDEHDIGLYLKRAMALSARYGNESAHRARYARLAGIEPVA